MYEDVIQAMSPGLSRAVLRVISMHAGQEHPVRREDLVKALRNLGFGAGMNDNTFDRKIRQEINALRKSGVLICASSGEAGYYVARTREEYDHFAEAEFRSKLADMSFTLAEMDRAADRQFGKQARAGQLAAF